MVSIVVMGVYITTTMITVSMTIVGVSFKKLFGL